MRKWKPTEKAEVAFTQGDCWRLAIAINQLSGLPLIFTAFEWPEGENPLDYPESFYWTHVGNQLPDGRVIDVQGVHSLAQWRTTWYSDATLTTNDPETITALLKNADDISFPNMNANLTARKLAAHFNLS